MKAIQIAFGAVAAVITSLIGSYIFITVFTNHSFSGGITYFKEHGLLGKIITLGTILNIILFYVLLQLNKEMMARGVILGMILLTILTLIV